MVVQVAYPTSLQLDGGWGTVNDLVTDVSQLYTAPDTSKYDSCQTEDPGDFSQELQLTLESLSGPGDNTGYKLFFSYQAVMASGILPITVHYRISESTAMDVIVKEGDFPSITDNSSHTFEIDLSSGEADALDNYDTVTIGISCPTLSTHVQTLKLYSVEFHLPSLASGIHLAAHERVILV